MAIDDEVRCATKLLETIMQAGGLTRKDLDQRLGSGPGYMSQLFTGRMELKLRHILAILRALDVEPGIFFQALYPDGRPAGENRLLEEFLKRYRSLGLRDAEAAAPNPAAAPPFGYDDLRQLIESAVRAALRERNGEPAAQGGGAPAAPAVGRGATGAKP